MDSKGKSPLLGEKEDVEVNITGCTYSGKALRVEDSCEDVPEASSSFSDTESGTENYSCLGDPEVESQMRDDWYELLQERNRRKTIHWRKFISPLMWRCKWMELKMVQLQSLKLKYEKELAELDHTKQLDFGHLKLDGSDIKSVPITGRMHRNKVKRRNKRKKVEENCDLNSYMSNHSLFSYYEKTDSTVDACLSDSNGVAVATGNNDNHHEEVKLNNEWTSVNHAYIDNSSYEILLKIEAIESHVQKLKTRFDKVISENQDRIAYSSKLQSESNMEDLLMDGNATPSLEVINPLIETSIKPQLDDPWQDEEKEERKDKTWLKVGGD